MDVIVCITNARTGNRSGIVFRWIPRDFGILRQRSNEYLHINRLLKRAKSFHQPFGFSCRVTRRQADGRREVENWANRDAARLFSSPSFSRALFSNICLVKKKRRRRTRRALFHLEVCSTKFDSIEWYCWLKELSKSWQITQILKFKCI